MLPRPSIALIPTISIFHRTLLARSVRHASAVAVCSATLLACGPATAQDAQLPVATHFQTPTAVTETTSNGSTTPPEPTKTYATAQHPLPRPLPVQSFAVDPPIPPAEKRARAAAPHTNIFPTPTATAVGALPVRPQNDVINAPSPIPTQAIASNDLQANRINLLLLGIDRAEAFVGNTDVMMVVSIDHQSNSVAVLSIPRDLCLGACETHSSRINEVYRVQSIEALQQTIHDLTHLRIDYWVLVNFHGVETIISRLGGIQVWSNRAFNERFVYLDTGEKIRLVLEEGWNTLNGREAVAFGRSRKYDKGGDFARICRQQQVIHALREQAISPALIANFPGFIADLNGTFKTNFPIDDARQLGELLLSIPPNRITSWTIHDHNAALLTPVTGLDGSDLLRPNPDTIRGFVRTLLIDSTRDHKENDGTATFIHNDCESRFPEFGLARTTTTSPAGISQRWLRGKISSPAG